MKPAACRWSRSTISTPSGRIGIRYRPADASPGADRAPLVAILHQSPLSGWMHEPVLDHPEHDGTVVILDTPGYGDSDPPDSSMATLDDYASELWSAIEIVRDGRPVMLVGQYTGAHLAMVHCIQHSESVSVVVFHGLSLYNDTERADRAAHYAPAIETRPDGAHLMEIWARLSRLYRGVNVELRNRALCDYLLARPHYAHAYHAVFASRVAPLIEESRATGIPSAVLIGTDDLVAGRQGRVAREFGSRVVALPGRSDFAPHESPHEFTSALAELISSLAVDPSPSRPNQEAQPWSASHWM